MSKKNTAFFIARRLMGSNDGESRGTMLRIAISTTAIAVAVMILSLAVVSGFKVEIAAKLTGFTSMLQIVNLDSNNSSRTQPIERNRVLEDSLAVLPQFSSMNVFALTGGVVKSDAAVAGVVLKGVGADYDWDFFAAALTQGSLPIVGDTVRHKQVLLSESLASKLDIEAGGRVEFVFVDSEGMPRRDRFRVSGLYRTGLAEMDDAYLVGDIADVQRLNRWTPSQITGYELTGRDFARIDDFESDVYAVTLRAEGDTPLMVVNVVDKYPNIFDWLKAHNVNAVVIITIMFIVALLSVLSALLIMLLERTRMIGILKALGMTDGAIQQIFSYRTLYVVIAGVAIGDAVGVALSLAQKYLNVIRLDSEGYFIDTVPVHLTAMQVVSVDVGIIVLLMLALSVPTMIISRIKPDKTIRYE